MIGATSSPSAPRTLPASSGSQSIVVRFKSSLPFALSLVAALGALGWLLFAPPSPEPEPLPPRATLKDAVQVGGPRLLAVAPDSPLGKKLESEVACKTTLTEPVFTVTGRVVASLRISDGKGNDHWQFDASEALATFADWQKAQADIAFARTQLASVKELSVKRNDAQKNKVARLEKLVEAGTDTKKDLADEQTNLMQFEILGRKEIHEAESALRIAERNEATSARQLQQAGLDPDLLRTSTSDEARGQKVRDTDIVMAEVPENRLAEVKVGLSCEAKFFGLPGQVFPSKVNRVLPVLSKDRHSLRVLFVISDPEDHVRPGMFAEIGLGTGPRSAILIPTDAILHVGRSDYVLVAEEPGQWRATEVKIGEVHGDRVEILDRALEGRRVLTKGAILLKPPLVLSLNGSR